MEKIGILVGGGPAPGINSVIGTATICANLNNTEVVGILEGFKWLIKGQTDHTIPLESEQVSRIHFQGGSILGTARDNPTKDPKHLETVVATLRKLGIKKLITIGGDDTLFSASQVVKIAPDISVVHVPKTIDNDLNLPHGQSTFGYQTARHLGVQLVKNLMNDAQTTNRWYFVTSMGRKSGLLALGIGKAAGATLTLIPEEFPNDTSLKTIADTIAGSIIKRLTSGKQDGLVVLAEGIIERIRSKDLQEVQTAERDEHGHIRYAEIQFGEIVKNAVQTALRELGISLTLVNTNIGYELRCADPIPFDMAYTRDLGFLAATHLINGGSAVVITVENMLFTPISFNDMMDMQTGRSKVRLVDTAAPAYHIAQTYMIKLKLKDFSDPDQLNRLAEVCGLDSEAFQKRFSYIAN